MTEKHYLKEADKNQQIAWRTISIVSIDGEPHAYQQKEEMKRAGYRKKSSFGSNKGDTLGPLMVNTEEHRMIPVSETIPDENAESLMK